MLNFGWLNANSSKMVKSTDFKFDKQRVSRNSRTLYTLPYRYLTLPSGGCTRHISAEATVWAQCITPTDLMVKKSPRGFCKPQENCPQCPVDTVKSVQ